MKTAKRFLATLMALCLVLGYSIGAYCSSQATKGGTIADLAMATAVYGYHAKAYFG